MSELADLITLFGAIDQAVGSQPSIQPTVAALLPAYDKGAAGWYNGIEAWLQVAQHGARGGSGQGGLPVRTIQASDLAGALGRLANTDPFSPYLTTRRLLALAVLSRLAPASGPPPPGLSAFVVDDATLAGALVPVTSPVNAIGGLTPQQRAGKLLDVLKNDKLYPDVTAWQRMMGVAQQEDLVTRAVANQPMIVCDWTVVPSTEAGGPAVAFETRMRVSGVPLAQIELIVDPKNWLQVLPPWCSMDDPTAGPAGNVSGSATAAAAAATSAGANYGPRLEVISWECGDPAAFELKTVLNFRQDPLPPGENGKVLQYRLGDPELGGDGFVTVDEGSLLVRDLGNGVTEVITTKRVQFSAFAGAPRPEAAWIAWFVWNMGYASAAELFIDKVADMDNLPLAVHVTWPQPAQPATGGGTNVQNVTPGVGSGGAASAPAPGQSGAPGQPGSLADQAVAAMEAAIQVYLQDVSSSWAKITSGQYGPADYVSDLGTLSNRLATNSATFFQIGGQLVPGSSGP
ncbi:MAG TPA: hypothetical protein VK277_03360 [Acidimicrobiales bacterium]|nr:hypothetical protein [Acidimicrobiales bacterium]